MLDPKEINEDDIERLATTIILNHAQDIEYLSVSEMLESEVAFISEEEYDAIVDRTYEKIGDAIISVVF